MFRRKSQIVGLYRWPGCGGIFRRTTAGQPPVGPAGADGTPMSADMASPKERRGGDPARQRADPWVIDFRLTRRVEGRCAVTWPTITRRPQQAVRSQIKDATQPRVPLRPRYSQGGMFCYPGAAPPARSKDICVKCVRLASGHPGRVAHGHPGERGRRFHGRSVFNRLDIPSWIARMEFQMMDPTQNRSG